MTYEYQSINNKYPKHSAPLFRTKARPFHSISQRRNQTMKIVKITLALSVIILSILSLTIDSMNLTPIMQLLLGALLITIGAEEIQKEKKTIGILLIISGFINLFIFIQVLFLS